MTAVSVSTTAGAPSRLAESLENAYVHAKVATRKEVGDALGAVIIGVAMEASGKLLPITDALVLKHLEDAVETHKGYATAAAQLADLDSARKETSVAIYLSGLLSSWVGANR